MAQLRPYRDASLVRVLENTLHHLSNFWKVEALKSIGDILHQDGIFRLRDLAYSFDPAESQEAIATWFGEMKATQFRNEVLYRHFREEFSTYGFILESILERTCFEILDATYRDGFCASDTCRWAGDS